MHVSDEESNLNVIKFVLDFIQFAFCHFVVFLHERCFAESSIPVSFMHKKNVEKGKKKNIVEMCVHTFA